MDIRHLFAFIVMAAMCSCHGNETHEHEHTHQHSHEGHSHEGHNHEGHNHATKAHNHEGEIAFHDEAAKVFGVTLDTVRAAEFSNIVRVVGRAQSAANASGIVSAPVAGTVHFVHGVDAGSHVGAGALIATVDASAATGGDTNAAAKATLDAARRELDRITPLYNDRLVTAAEYNAAVAAYEQAKASYSPRAAGGRAVSPIAGTVVSLDVAEGEWVDVGRPIAQVASAADLILRVEMPRRYLGMVSGMHSVVVEQPYSEPVELPIRRIPEPVAGTSNTSATVPMFIATEGNANMSPGATFTAYLIGSPRQGVISLPVGAISEQQGSYFVYERVHPEAYAKRRVTLGASDGRRVEITSGIKPGAVVVSNGASTLRLAETSAAIPEGHTHNH